LRREKAASELDEQRKIFRTNMLVKKIQRYWRAKKAKLSGVANTPLGGTCAVSTPSG
jgi:hypothetical protein